MMISISFVDVAISSKVRSSVRVFCNFVSLQFFSFSIPSRCTRYIDQSESRPEVRLSDEDVLKIIVALTLPSAEIVWKRLVHVVGGLVADAFFR